MTHIEGIAPPPLSTLSVQIVSPDTLVLKGTIACKDPVVEVGPFVRSVHEAALADRLAELRVDVRELHFVNSSAIRLFIDWAGWIKSGSASLYKLRFTTSRRVTWQKTSFLALQSLAAGALSVEQVD